MRKVTIASAAMFVLGALATIALALYLGPSKYAATGDTYPGTVTAVGYPLLRLTATLAGAVTIGALVYSTVCTRFTKDGRLGPDGFAGVTTALRASGFWAVASGLLIVFSASDATGVSVFDVLRRGALFDVIEPNEAPKAWIVTTILALIVTVATRWTFTWVSVALSGAVAAVGILPVVVIGNAGQGRHHDVMTSAAIVAVIALATLTGLTFSVALHLERDRGRPSSTAASDTSSMLRRFRAVSAACLAAMAVTTPVLAWTLLKDSAITKTVYGLLFLCAAMSFAMCCSALLACFPSRGSSSRSGRAGWLATAGGCSSIAVWVFLSNMAIRPAPTFYTTDSTIYDVFLGYEPPGPPSASDFLTFWRFDFLIGGAAIVLGFAYGAAAVRLRRRGDDWPLGRTVAWMTGCVALLCATSSGFSAYGSAMFSVHMAVHMTLNMFVPVLLVLGGPVTLALRALAPARHGAMPGTREWILCVVHSVPMRWASTPAVATTLFVLSPFAVYFTPLFDTLVRYHWGHELMNIHFVVTGYLYYWVIIGIDPGPKRLPHLGRLALLFAAMPFHAFFGIAVMTMNRIIGDSFYRYLSFPWMHDLAADQRVGGGLAWATSEVPLLMVVAALLTQWARQDRRTEVRRDRATDLHDEELDAYNAMLSELSRQRR
ncbi:cytochrome c oxidase assembly protein [Rhodococcus sp. IEGM 1354]|uniref:cytochrome c oxidase assembly protein n=1 Tax=Rhodococcus sp. IEGM 1354 TaxID=3047088 RepID=UPI0024B86487|nr:cytochrome c oxidase assembly protein [Rhodococcus sp. IEGM 1354]MDI9929706.1 cytochrome c oxidase assembly protein [Rhodococcus sp. IEGM 1354]